MARQILIHMCIIISIAFANAISALADQSPAATSYIVHMDLSAMPKAFPHPHNWYRATLTSISSSSSITSKRMIIYAYNHVINGFSATLLRSELEALKASPGYVSSTKDSYLKLHTTRSTDFLGLNHDFGAWPDSECGKDVIIGVVDSGIWPESRSYNDDGMTQVPSRWKGECQNGTQFNSSMCNKKLIGARHFNRGLFALDPTSDLSMNSSRDTSGHGTHTSSTAAGNRVDGASYFGYAPGTARGVAPWARVAVYKALWGYDGACAQSDILAAIDQAIMDGVDILSLSYGSYEQEPLFSETNSIATFAAMERGIFISASAGNSYNLLTVKNAAPWILTVAASTIDRELSGRVTLGNRVLVTGSSLYHGGLVSGQLVYMGRCLNSTGLDQSAHQIVVCLDNGNDGLRNQVGHVEYSRAYGGIFITDSLEVSDTMETSFPAVFLNSQNGEVIMDYMKSRDKAKATLEFQETSVGTKPAPRVADYSSRGPSRSCPFVLKPDLTAPGSLIIASWSQYVRKTSDRSRQPKQEKKFNIESGTSMAAPHAAGVAALLKAAYPEWSPAAIRSAMMTTSDVLDNTFKPIHEITSEKIKLATPLSMGAGHINPNKAMDPGLIYDITSEDYVNLLCGLNFTKEQIQMITRSSSYSCSKPTLDINYPSFIAFFSADGSNTTIAKEFQRMVTYVGNGTSTFVAKLTPLNGLTASVVPDKMVFKEKYEKQSYKLNIEGPGQLTDEVVYGFLSWEETPGKHVVRSPIVVTNLYPK